MAGGQNGGKKEERKAKYIKKRCKGRSDKKDNEREG